MQVAEGRADLLRRQVVKSNTTTVTVPELQFEIPPGTQKGVITTVEGLLTDASTGLRCFWCPLQTPMSLASDILALRLRLCVRCYPWHCAHPLVYLVCA